MDAFSDDTAASSSAVVVVRVLAGVGMLALLVFEELLREPENNVCGHADCFGRVRHPLSAAGAAGR